jgi:DNA-binding transcriptional ArsR family regulator
VVAEHELQHPAIEDIDLSTVLAALADPMRRRVVLELAQNPDTERLCASFELPVAKSTRTHHWRVLREAGLVWQRDAGNRLVMRLRQEDLHERFPGLLDTLAALEAP